MGLYYFYYIKYNYLCTLKAPWKISCDSCVTVVRSEKSTEARQRFTDGEISGGKSDLLSQPAAQIVKCLGVE